DKNDKLANNNRVRNDGIRALNDLLTSGGAESGKFKRNFFLFFNLRNISVPNKAAMIANNKQLAETCSSLIITIASTVSSRRYGVNSTTFGNIVTRTATAITPGITPSSS